MFKNVDLLICNVILRHKFNKPSFKLTNYRLFIHSFYRSSLNVRHVFPPALLLWCVNQLMRFSSLWSTSVMTYRSVNRRMRSAAEATGADGYRKSKMAMDGMMSTSSGLSYHNAGDFYPRKFGPKPDVVPSGVTERKVGPLDKPDMVSVDVINVSDSGLLC